MTQETPSSLHLGGDVLLRQTTFWEIVTRTPAPRAWRVHFSHKAEHGFVGPLFEHAALVERHPLLLDHQEALDSLFVSSPSPDPDAVLLELELLAGTHFDGWRTMARYLHRDYPARELLAGGHGLLLRAPRSFVQVCTAQLVQRGIRVDPPAPGPIPRRRPLQALLLGRNFIVAERFSFESLPGTTPA